MGTSIPTPPAPEAPDTLIFTTALEVLHCTIAEEVDVVGVMRTDPKLPNPTRAVYVGTTRGFISAYTPGPTLTTAGFVEDGGGTRAPAAANA